MGDDKVIFLAYSNPNPTTEASTITVASCTACGNKTFLMRLEVGTFPALHCAACQTLIGRVGWIHEGS